MPAMVLRKRARPQGQSREVLESSGSSNEALIAPKRVKTVRSEYKRAPRFANHVLFVFVGPFREVVTLHTDLLPLATREFIEARGTVHGFYLLPELSPEPFHFYRLFLYAKRIFSQLPDDLDMGVDGDAAAVGDSEWMRLAHMYILAKTLKDERFANSVVTAFIEKVRESDRYPTGLAEEVYANLPAGDRLRHLIVDFHVWKGLGTWLKEPHEDAHGPKQFKKDVRRRLKVSRRKVFDDNVKAPWESSLCASYHTHVDSAPQSTCQAL